MRSRHFHLIVLFQAVILLIFLLLTITNEVLDLPHFMLGDKATTWNQRIGEISFELIIFMVAITFEIVLSRRLIRRIKILEGFLPICANCKRIRNQNHWEQIENYISRHSLARFSHSLCPECLKKLYPDLKPPTN